MKVPFADSRVKVGLVEKGISADLRTLLLTKNLVFLPVIMVSGNKPKLVWVEITLGPELALSFRILEYMNFSALGALRCLESSIPARK